VQRIRHYGRRSTCRSDRKLLEHHGLDGEIISMSASPIAVQALMSGDLAVTVTSVTTVAPSRPPNNSRVIAA
jgi:ABC-type cobalamin transport system permease subunit